MACNGLRHGASFPHDHQLLLIFTLVFSISVIAQVPEFVINPAYATIDEKTFYIQGGSIANTTNSTSNQFFALDLDKSSWNPSNPPWRQLSTGFGTQSAPTDYSHSMTVINNQQSLLVWGWRTGISTYNTTGGSWSVTNKPTTATSKMDGLHAVTDPSTGLVYIPAGANQGQNMTLYNPSSNTTQLLPIPPTFGKSAITHYGAVWSTLRGTILMYGGYYESNSKASSPNLFEYTPSSAAWTLVSTSGELPGDINNHCMAPGDSVVHLQPFVMYTENIDLTCRFLDSSAYNGTKLVLFGGQTTDRTPLDSIYILDVSTMVWEKGTDVDPSLNRNGMACSVAGDNFIAWGGGQAGKYISALQTPVIYNLRSNQWTNQFVLPVSSTSNRAPSAALIGGIIVAVVVVIGILLLVLKRYRSSKDRTEEEIIQSYQQPMQEPPVSPNALPLIPMHKSPKSPQLYVPTVSWETKPILRNPHEIQNL